MGRSEAGLTAACTVKQAGPEEMAGKWCLVACLVAATVLATRAAADKPAQDGDIAESQSIIQESSIQELVQDRQQREAFPGKAVQQRSNNKKGSKGKRGTGKQRKNQAKRKSKSNSKKRGNGNGKSRGKQGRKQRKNKARRAKKSKKNKGKGTGGKGKADRKERRKGGNKQ